MKKVDFKKYTKSEFIEIFTCGDCPDAYEGLENNSCKLDKVLEEKGIEPATLEPAILWELQDDICEKCWESALKDVTFADEVQGGILKQIDDIEKSKEYVDAYYRLGESKKIIAEYYGTDLQMDMMIEECSELIQAIMKNKRKATEETMENVIEEMADVYLVLDQLIDLLKIGNKVIEIANKKAERQLERIKKEVVECTKK